MKVKYILSAAAFLPFPLLADVSLRLPDSAHVPCLTDATGAVSPMGVTMAQIFENFALAAPGLYAGYNAVGDESLPWGIEGEGTWSNVGGYAAALTLCGRSASHGETLVAVLDSTNSELITGSLVQSFTFSGNGTEGSALGTGYTLGLAVYDATGALLASSVSAAGDAQSHIPMSTTLSFDAPHVWKADDALLVVVRGADKAHLFIPHPIFTVENLRVSAAIAVPEVATGVFSLMALPALLCYRRRGNRAFILPFFVKG